MLDDETFLHVTNGDSTVAGLRAAGFAGALLAWRDVLEAGPVPAGLGERALARERGRFLAQEGFEAAADAESAFVARDRALSAALGRRPVVLWFEHDLYDQLQLVQILARLSRPRPRADLICVGPTAKRPGFGGLGELAPAELRDLWPGRRPVESAAAALGARAFDAFRSRSPEPLLRLLAADLAPLPFLRPALMELLRDYPHVDSGLSALERALLEPLRAAPATPGALHASLRPAGMPTGDWLAFAALARLAAGTTPLVAALDACPLPPPPPRGAAAPFLGCMVQLTAAGKRVLEAGDDAIAVRGIDRWIGGVHLTPASPWRFDPRRGTLVGAA